MPMPIVMRSRLRSTTDEPPSDDDTPPPNRSDRPPPFPLWSRTSTIISRLVMTSTISKAMVTGGSTFSGWLRVWCVRCARVRHQGTSGGGFLGHLLVVAADRHELVRVDARAADQGAVHVGLCHDARDVVGLDRPAVQDPHAVGEVAGVELRQPRAQRGAHLLRVLGC